MTNMTGLAAPLAAALAEKGYASLTPVQQAVLAPGLPGRDLLVSAQTGSGKTVAFGLAIAPEVLAGAEMLAPAEKPLALVVAPTRELALQVRRELEWLYGGAGALFASCVGGMDYRTERRALNGGAHIVVGTPGRLRDHIERGSLDLSAIRAAVLDEADEMLDLGFAEDLGFILSAAPENRRTLMFSATVPKDIEKLAQTFQKDAQRVVAQGEARQHVDIAYQALQVAPRDRDHAIFNVLRFHEARCAIVFCKTRANVNQLLARMGNRGFQVVALSGELSQQERTHALQALRDGRARVCIATDVAARGIDLPGLELVVHADLPSNSEILLHRSGRTGRAGAKGTSVLIVPPPEVRKAQRLLSGAKVEAAWGPPPSADAVAAQDEARLLAHPALAAPAGDDADLAADLLAEWGPEQVAAAFIRLWREGRSAPEVLSDAAHSPPPARAPRERAEFGPAVWFAISVGHEGRAEARWLLPKICDAGGITKDAIGAIRVQAHESFVQIAADRAAGFGTTVELGPDLTMRRLDGEPDLNARPAARPAPAREKPAYVPKPPRVVDDAAAGTSFPAAAMPDAEPVARKPYVRRDESDHKPLPPRGAGEARPYTPRPADETRAYAPRAAGEGKPRARREDADRKPLAPRAADGAKPYARRDDSDRKPWAPRAAGEGKPRAGREDGDRKPYAPRADGDRKPHVPRAAAEGKPYAPRTATGTKPHVKRDDEERKPFGARADSDRKPHAPRAGGEAPAKPRWSKDAPGGAPRFASHGSKSHGDRAPRAAGYKSHKDGATPRDAAPAPAGEDRYAPRGGTGHAGAKPGADRDKPFAKGPRTAGFKSHKTATGGTGGAKPFLRGKPPAAAPTDARDTSKRFVPPKRPRT